MTELCISGQIIKLASPFAAGKHWFNAGIAKFHGKTVLMSRVARVPSMMALSELGDDYQPRETQLIPRMGGDCIPEDPRLVSINGHLSVFYVGILDGANCATFHADIDQDYRVLRKERLNVAGIPDAPVSDGAAPGLKQQKNWVPFFKGGRLHAVYSHDPFIVIAKSNSGRWGLVYRGDGLKWDFGLIRGGTPPVKRGDLWYSFFHSARFEQSEGGETVKVYHCGCCTFDDSFHVLSMTRRPILSADPDRHSHPWYGGGSIAALFPCGALLSGDNWLISYGWLDTQNRIAEIPCSALDEYLSPLVGESKC